MPRSESFHHHNDGRGKRRVYVNGNEVECVIWCETSQGIAVFAPRPFRSYRASGEVYTRRLRGSVIVERVD